MMWSGERCLDCGINVEEPAATLEALAVKCNGVVRRALQLLRRAQNSRDKTLTRKMVDDHLFLD
jgi:hypothetical protein